MSDIVKSGYIKRYSKSFLNGGWNKSFLELHRDSTLNVYKKQGDSKCQGSIFLKDVCKYFAYGEYTAGMPDRPDLPSGASYDCIMGIPQKPSSKAKIHWFLFSSSNELHDWMKAICSVLPPPPQKDPNTPHQGQQQPVHHQPPPAATAPPPLSGGGPPLGFEHLTLGAPPPYNPNPGAPPYRPPPSPQQQHHYPPQQQYGPPPPVAYPPPQPQGYYQQPGYAAPGPTPGYPQQQYYQQPSVRPSYPGYYNPAAPQYYTSAGGYQHPPQQVYVHQQPVVYQTRTKSGFPGGNTGKIVAGLAGGALLGYGASRMMGGGWGMGRWGSWSSLSSFGSFGSCGSFGSFGSFG